MMGLEESIAAATAESAAHRARMAEEARTSQEHTQQFIDHMRARDVGCVALYQERQEPTYKTVGFLRRRHVPTGEYEARNTLIGHGWVVTETADAEGPNSHIILTDNQVYRCGEISTMQTDTAERYVVTRDQKPLERTFAFRGYALAEAVLRLTAEQQ